MLKKYKKSFLLIFICSLFLLLAFPFTKTFAEQKYKDLKAFAKVLTLIQDFYIEEVDMKKLIYGGIRGVLRELDPHSFFLSPDIYKEFSAESSGEFHGIGIELSSEKGLLIIIAPIEDTPAWKAGLKPGDQIVSINGEPAEGLGLSEAAQKIKKSKKKAVKLGIIRKGLQRAKIYSIKRAIIKINPVKYTDLNDGYMYVRITSFISNTSRNFKKIVSSHIRKHNKVKGLILDLRRNPGGLLNQAIKMSDLFLSKGTIVSTRGRGKGKEETVKAQSDGTLAEFPMIILIDEYSASASEILAGALKDNKRALLMGERSFGKGSVQSIIKLEGGAALKLTVARYYTPKGTSIQAEGITPDIQLKKINIKKLGELSSNAFKKREENIEGHLPREQKKANQKKSRSSKNKVYSKKERLLKEDFQVLQAYNYLKVWKVMQK